MRTFFDFLFLAIAVALMIIAFFLVLGEDVESTLPVIIIEKAFGFLAGYAGYSLLKYLYIHE